jgi:hypothetical protein
MSSINDMNDMMDVLSVLLTTSTSGNTFPRVKLPGQRVGSLCLLLTSTGEHGARVEGR